MNLAHQVAVTLDGCPGSGPPQVPEEILAALGAPDGGPDGGLDPVRCACLVGAGQDEAENALAETLRRVGRGAAESTAAARTAVRYLLESDLCLTGAEAAAAVLAAGGVTHVFAYPGTSELALCDAVDRVLGMRLVNGRGDKESAFMAAGGSLLRPNKAVAVLHGARGLTNATGAVADARRNEAGTVFIVGLPSTGSARFLPPHGEPDLIGAMSAFADWTWQASPVPAEPAGRDGAARGYVANLRQALASAAEPPHRPAIFGVPQDVAEDRWIPIAAMLPPAISESSLGTVADLVLLPLENAIRELRAARRPLFLVDDYALRYPGFRQALDTVSRAVGGAVMQLRYRRGPMLFERLRQDEVQNFVGWLNQFSPAHRELLDACDLLVTLEDRNLYERVVGPLPGCRKIAINSDPDKVLKNEYLTPGDTLLVGNPGQVLADIGEHLGQCGADARPAWFSPRAGSSSADSPEQPSADVAYGRRGIVRALVRVLAGWRQPVLIDDSQMFGGLLSEHYDDFPRGLRVFGGHGGFVGGGLAYATGLAIANPDLRVMCTLGDQGFTNSFQGLAAAVQERARVMFVVCNNGASVSLRKQAAASYGWAARSYLSNVPGLEYHRVAEAMGLCVARAAVPVGWPARDLVSPLGRLSSTLEQLASVDGPSLLELALPADPGAWRGIWITQGFEQVVRAAVA